MSCSISSSSSSSSSHTSARISIGDTTTTEVLLRQEEQVIDFLPSLLDGDQTTITNKNENQTEKENLSTPAVVDLSSPSDQRKQSAPVVNNNPESSYFTDDSLLDCCDIIDISPPAPIRTPKHPQQQQQQHQPQKEPAVTFVQRAVYSAHQQGILDDLAAQQGLVSRLDAFRCNDGASRLGGRPVLRVSNGDSNPARESTARRRKSSVQSKLASTPSGESMELITSVTRKSIIRPRATPNVRSLSSLPRTSRSITARNIALSTASATPGTTPDATPAPPAPAPGTRLSKSERDAHTLRMRLASLPCPQDAIAKMQALRLKFPRSGCCNAASAARELMCESEMLRLFDAACRRDEAGAVEVVNSMSFISLRLDGSACEDEPGDNAIEVPCTPSPEPDEEMLETEGWRDEEDPKTVPSSQPSQQSQQNSPLLIPPCEEIPPQIINVLALSSSSNSVIVLSDNAEYDYAPARTDAKCTYEAEISDSESEGAYTSDVDANFLLSSSPFPQRRSISPVAAAAAAVAAPPKRSIFASSSPLRAPSPPVLQHEREFHSSRSAAESSADCDDNTLNESSPRKSKTKRRKKSTESSEREPKSTLPPPPSASAGEADEETKRLLGLPAAELRAKLNAWGLKAPRKKVNMVDMIVEYSARLMGVGSQPPPRSAVSQVDLESSTEVSEQPQPQMKKDETAAAAAASASVMTSTEIRSAIMNRISIHVRTAETARAWWLRILKYEPIMVEDFAEYLVHAGVLVAAARGGREGEDGEEVDGYVLSATKEWCDSRCVCTISKTGPGQARVKKKAKRARR